MENRAHLSQSQQSKCRLHSKSTTLTDCFIKAGMEFYGFHTMQASDSHGSVSRFKTLKFSYAEVFSPSYLLVASVIHSSFGHYLKASLNESYNGANCYKQ